MLRRAMQKCTLSIFFCALSFIPLQSFCDCVLCHAMPCVWAHCWYVWVAQHCLSCVCSCVLIFHVSQSAGTPWQFTFNDSTSAQRIWALAIRVRANGNEPQHRRTPRRDTHSACSTDWQCDFLL